ncbi:ankyrin repeat-containing domain protein [Aspergillus karnatakaensis]|uniref:ankyrin repeat domain-containing protein n=1 Tax=Aspergillus karnatakaensis TaxID=1810916 RepID=UPI003CCCC22B
MTGAELIHAVATNKHTKCIEFILAQEPNRESQIEWTAWFMQTPLHFAIDRPRVRVAVVRYLLERGAEIDEVTSDGMTAIYLAAKHGHEGVVRELLKRSPRLDLKGGFRQRTVLHQAAEHCSLKVVNMLVEAGADVYARDKDGMTVLEYARKGRQRETVELVSSTFGLETLIEQAI